MSQEVDATAAASPPTWPVLNLVERRVLGVLVEKSKTTPDTYPMSINALVTGCNQKNNRDPILDLSDADVEDALTRAKQKGLAIMVTGGRVVRWRQALYEALHVNKIELAILAELLLRGPQTEGELRSRASRMEPIDDLDSLRSLLKQLAGRRLVVYLTPEGRRGTVVTHGFQAPEDLERLRTKHSAEVLDEVMASRALAVPSANPAALASELAEVESLKKEVAELRQTVAGLADQLRSVKEALGM